MAAEVLANDVKLDLYKIDLSSVVSKYIGETEKNLKKIFEEAETSMDLKASGTMNVKGAMVNLN